MTLQGDTCHRRRRSCRPRRPFQIRRLASHCSRIYPLPRRNPSQGLSPSRTLQQSPNQHHLEQESPSQHRLEQDEVLWTTSLVFREPLREGSSSIRVRGHLVAAIVGRVHRMEVPAAHRSRDNDVESKPLLQHRHLDTSISQAESERLPFHSTCELSGSVWTEMYMNVHSYSHLPRLQWAHVWSSRHLSSGMQIVGL